MGDKPCIRIGHLKIIDHLILGIAAHRIEQKIDGRCSFILDPVSMNTWNQVVEGLLEEDIDGAFILAPEAMGLFGEGTDHRLLLYTHRSGSIIVKNRASNITKPADFKGKVVLVPNERSIHTMLFHRLMKSVGLTLGLETDSDADVFMEVLPPYMMPEALQYDEKGEIAGFFAAEPFGALALNNGFADPFCSSAKLWPDHPCCVFVLHNRVISNFPGAVEELVRELVRSGMTVYRNRDKAISQAQGFLGVEKDVAGKILEDSTLGFSTSGLLPVMSELEVIQDYMVDILGFMGSRIDLNRFVDDSFALNAGAK